MNENDTTEIVDDNSPQTTPLPYRKALILVGTAAGIILAGGLALLKQKRAEEVVDLDGTVVEEIDIEIDTDTDQT